jgi:hypothetical protein
MHDVSIGIGECGAASERGRSRLDRNDLRIGIGRAGWRLGGRFGNGLSRRALNIRGWGSGGLRRLRLLGLDR